MGFEELVIADCDYVRLVSLAGDSALAEELERATVLPLERMPEGVVRMHSRVTYSIEGTAAERQVQLVYPDEADPAAGKVSVLAPVGAGLLGLQEGQTIDWPFFPDGNMRRLRVVRAEAPAN